MLQANISQRCVSRCQSQDRRGNIIVLSAVAMVMVLGFTALTVDIGFMMSTKTQMQAAVDGSTLAAALEMPQGWGAGKTLTYSQVDTAGRTAAQTVAALHRVGEQSSAYLDITRDVKFGLRTQNSQGAWVETWGTSPYNMVQVTIHRDQVVTGNSVTRADQQVPLFFAPAMGNNYAGITATATAVLSPGDGFSIPAGSGLTCPVLPIAVDDVTWNNLINSGVGTDSYKYTSSTGAVTSGTDGIKEINIYPTGTGSPGNRGTVNIGVSNNSTAILSRQIRYGLSESDLSMYGGTLRIPASGTLSLSGNPGLSAAIGSDLTAIIGQPRAIPIFSSCTGNGNNAVYTIVKFVGVRVLFAQLTGNPSSKQVIIQPAPVFSTRFTSGTGQLKPDSIMAELKLIH